MLTRCIESIWECLSEKRGDARKAHPNSNDLWCLLKLGQEEQGPSMLCHCHYQPYRNFICFKNSSSVWKNDNCCLFATKSICGNFKGLLMSQEQHRNRQCQNPSWSCFLCFQIVLTYTFLHVKSKASFHCCILGTIGKYHPFLDNKCAWEGTHSHY